jgi:hypothetical protein
MITRRNALIGLFAAPAIIAIERLMPVRALKLILPTAPRVWFVSSLALASVTKKGATFYIDPRIPTGADWDNAFPTLAEAINNPLAGPNDTYMLADGHCETASVIDVKHSPLVVQGGPSVFRDCKFNVGAPIDGSDPAVLIRWKSPPDEEKTP